MIRIKLVCIVELVSLKVNDQQMFAFATSVRLNLPCRSKRNRCTLYARAEVIVVGGGAAGFYLAREAALGAGKLANVQILESGSRVLRKVRASGGGRCNVTSALHRGDHRAFSANYPRGMRAMPAILARHDADQVVQFFESHGVPLKTEETGKVFPVSDTSADVVRALTDAARAAGVRVKTKQKVSDVRRTTSGDFEVVVGDEVLRADYVALTSGDAPKPLTWVENMGHTIVPQIPSLFSFVVRDSLLDGLAGVAVADAKVRLVLPDEVEEQRKRKREPRIDSQRGPLLVTHWGLSGPAVLALSSFAARALHACDTHADCVVDWAPKLSRAEKERVIATARRVSAARRIDGENPFRNFIPRRLWAALVAQCKLRNVRWGDVSNVAANRILDAMHATVFHVSGRGEFKEEFVTAGGVCLNDVNLASFESKKIPRLYFAGEILNVDGKTGGFNLTGAWSSGYIAGNAIAKSICPRVDTEENVLAGA